MRVSPDGKQQCPRLHPTTSLRTQHGSPLGYQHFWENKFTNMSDAYTLPVKIKTVNQENIQFVTMLNSRNFKLRHLNVSIVTYSSKCAGIPSFHGSLLPFADSHCYPQHQLLILKLSQKRKEEGIQFHAT